MVMLYTITHFITTLINRMLRHRNIRRHGYPPEHCDADGDFRNIFNGANNENEGKN